MIYGFGTIGKQLAKRLVPFSPKRLVAIKRFSWQGEKPGRIDEIGVEKDFSRLSKGIDIVFICCTQNKDNLGIVDKIFIQNLNPNAIIINIARVTKYNY
jgi:lactate dehydrogenase-like 2-hydroxyacid dehydrogenase